MPILGPGGVTQFLISDIANDVIPKTEGRTTDLARAFTWVRDALLEIAGNTDYRDDFAELEVKGPLFNLTGGSTVSLSTQEYAEGLLIPPGNLNQATLDILIWRDPPNNQVRQKLNPSHYQEADKSVVIPSVPTSWYRFGGNLGFYPTPDKNYQVQARILKMHPINDNQLQSTVILLPRDWNDILAWAATERGFMELGEYEKAGSIHTLLHGDPRYPEKPGMINGRKKRRAQEAHRVSGRLQLLVPKYINR